MKKLADGTINNDTWGCGWYWAIVEIDMNDWTIPDEGYADGGRPYEEEEMEDIMRTDVLEFLDCHRYDHGPGLPFGCEPQVVFNGNLALVSQRQGHDV